MTRASIQPSSYRWVILFTASSMLAIAMGQLVNGFSPFFAPLEDTFGWSRGEISLINTFGLLGLAVGGILMGTLADRVNVRHIVLCGAVITSLTLIAASRANALWQFYSLMFVAGALGGGALFAPLFALVGTWFRTGAGLAIGIASAGQAIGQGGVPFANTLLIEWFGWRDALLVLGVFSCMVMVPLALLIRQVAAGKSVPSQDNAGTRNAILPVKTVVIFMSAATLFCCSLMAVPLMHLVPHIQTRGLSAPEAGSVLMVMMIVAIAGRVAFGRLADMIGAIPSYMVASVWQTVLVFPFSQFSDLTHLYIFAVVYGFGYAGVMTGVLTTIRALTPDRQRAGATGIILAFAWAGHGVGGYLGGAMYDFSGGYALSFGIAAVAGLVNIIIVVFLWLRVQGVRGSTKTNARPAQPALAA